MSDKVNARVSGDNRVILIIYARHKVRNGKQLQLKLIPQRQFQLIRVKQSINSDDNRSTSTVIAENSFSGLSILVYTFHPNKLAIKQLTSTHA